MIRVLHIVNSMGVGGIETFLMNLYRTIDKSEYQFDFLLHKKSNSYYEEEIINKGGQLFYVPTRRDGILKAKSELSSFYSNHPEYQIVHEHVSSLSDIDGLIYAKKFNKMGRIIHAHSTAAPGNKIHEILHRINKPKVKTAANIYYSCSDAATEWLYSGTGVEHMVEFVPNGIDVKRFSFRAETRERYRRELNVVDKHVIIHVGRMSYEKNHDFLLDVFKEYHEKDGQSVLVLVGDGVLANNIKNKIENLGLDDAVILLGLRKDVPELLMAADLFVLPSMFEGFPVSIIEAQATGIPCLYSDTITQMAKITKNTIQLPIEQGTGPWLEGINNAFAVGRDKDASEDIRSSIFNIQNVADMLCTKYKEILR